MLQISTSILPTEVLSFTLQSLSPYNLQTKFLSTDGRQYRNGVKIRRCSSNTFQGTESAVTQSTVVDDFDDDLARDLRAEFDRRFSDPLKTDAERFVWDYWYVPGQYRLLRTPAHAFFSQSLYDRLEDALVEFGERRLGCRGISPIWLSYYVDGCRQELHTDAPHGPWAFVYSLTHWEDRKFDGGETVLLNSSLLLDNYWGAFDPSRGLETPQLTKLIEPRFGRLSVFDPRIPHGVRIVEGVKDPIQSRIVLHGWFTTPTPFFQGSMSQEEATSVLNAALDSLYEELSTLPPVVGTVTVRLRVMATGDVQEMTILTNTIVARYSEDDIDVIFDCIRGNMLAVQFPCHSSGTPTDITLPFVFQ